MTPIWLYDCETNGLLRQLDRLHCLVLKDVAEPDFKKRRLKVFRKHDGYLAHFLEDGREVGPLKLKKLAAANPELVFHSVWKEPEDTIREGVDLLMGATVVGHNLIGFDEKAVKKCYPDYKSGRVIDTLVQIRVAKADIKDQDFQMAKVGKLPGKLIGSHSLDAWGYRLGFNKGDYSVEMIRAGLDPWAGWNKDMEEYCVNDVHVNEVLWEALKKEMIPDECSDLEHAIHSLATEMTEQGVPFDHAAALTLRDQLQGKLDATEAEVKDHFGFWFAPKKKKVVAEPWPIDNEVRDQIEAQIDRLVEQLEKYAHKYTRLQQCAQQYKGEAQQKAKMILAQEEPSLVAKIDRCKTFMAKLQGQIASMTLVNAEPNRAWAEDTSRPVWADFTVTKRTIRSKNIGDRTEGAAYCPIRRVDFNPGSRTHIIDRLTQLYGWVPTEFTEKGQPKVDDTVLRGLIGKVPFAEELAEIFFYKKLLGQLETGPGSWLKAYDETTGKIHHYINTGGTVSGRCAHNSPNLGQVVAVVEATIHNADGTYSSEVLDANGEPYPEALEAETKGKKKCLLRGRPGDYGLECRSLFYVPKYGYYVDEVIGQDNNVIEVDVPWYQIGCDLKGIEFRCLAELVAPFDNGELIDIIVSGQDVHAYNMEKCGINSRSLIKRLLYGLMYGAGDWKLGHTADPTLNDVQKRALGRDLRRQLMEGLPALAQAIAQVKEEAEAGFLIGLDGRRLSCRSPHSALNLRLQSNAALIAKKWAVLTYERMLKSGFKHGWFEDFVMMLFVHDELQSAARDTACDAYQAIVVQAAKDAGKAFNFQCPVDADVKVGHNWAETH